MIPKTHGINFSFGLPNMAELRAAHIVSRRDAHNCQPNGLDHGFEYASKLNASYNFT